MRNAEGEVTKLVYKERMKLAEIFREKYRKLKEEIEDHERFLIEIIRNIVLISRKELKKEVEKEIKEEEESEHEDEIVE